MIVSMPTTARPQQRYDHRPSRSRSTHRGRDHRHGPRSPSLDGAWLAGRGADGRGLSGCCGPHGAGAPTGGPEAAATRPQAHGAAPARAGRVTNLRVSPHRSASAGRTRQDADPARRGSGPRVPPVTSGPAVPAGIAQSVPRMAPAAARVLDDQSSCPRTSPSRLTFPEVRAIEEMVTSPEYRHVPTGRLAVLAQQLGKVWASPSTW